MSESESSKLTLSLLRDATAEAAAIRLRARLQPVGGCGDKVFPPTYVEGQDGRKHDSRYATEVRVIGEERLPTVLLDSVASQANRMELGLLDAFRAGRILLPVLSVDFESEFPDIGRISSLEAPHRVYDAILRDATMDGTPFRASEIGMGLTAANVADARAMFTHCPTALLFGAWDSTGPLGGMGNKFQRAIVSEVVGIDFEAGKNVGSRLDPLHIAAGVRLDIPKGNSNDWKVDPKGKGKASGVNHSNIPPTRDDEAGGVTLRYGLHTAVLSMAALRRLRFGNWSAEQSEAARAVVAALGVVALVQQRRAGYDFRSRCSLVPEGRGMLEVVRPDGAVTTLDTDVDAAEALLASALETASKLGVNWDGGEKLLMPIPKLVQLVAASREHYAAGGAGD